VFVESRPNKDSDISSNLDLGGRQVEVGDM